MLTVITGLGAALSYATSDLFSQRVARRTRPMTQLAWVMCTGVAIIVPIALLVDGLPDGPAQWRAAGLAALAGVVYFIELLLFLTGLRVGDLGLVCTLVSLEGAFAAVAFIALGESVTPLKAVGLTVCAVGAVLASMEGRARTARGVGWALSAAALMAAVMILYGYAGEISWVSQTAFSRVSSLLCVLPVALLSGGMAVPRGFRLQAGTAGVLELGGIALLIVSLGLGPATVAGVMASQVGTFAVIIGFVGLRERPRPSQWLGIILTLAGVALLGALG